MKQESILQKRWKKFKGLKRGYYSLCILLGLYFISFFLPFIINNRALIVSYGGDLYFPVISGYIPGKQFGQDVPGEARYRLLQETFSNDKGNNNWVIMPLYEFSPLEDITFEGNKMFEPPSKTHWLGTDNTGRDVFARLCYAFNISISFGLILTVINYIVGIFIGGCMGYYGGKFDLFFQRLIEVWSSLPMLFVIIIISSILKPSFILLIGIYTLVNWISMTYLIRAEFYREKAKPYVAAALSMGQSDFKVMFKHILPNSLVPIITYFPVFRCSRHICTCRTRLSWIWLTSTNSFLGTDVGCGTFKHNKMVDGLCASFFTIFYIIGNCFHWRRRSRSL